MNLTTLGLTSIQIFLFFGFNTPVNAEQYKRHKYTCPESQSECTEGERAAIKLVNAWNKYGTMYSYCEMMLKKDRLKWLDRTI